ncbi:hypothetical protein JZ751_017564 [Albula glossodonta]|uniref:Uncharacterized protein n=1 Tax=Albula glossodonta TaxID=121402 RepID=A0A8T2PNW9_9TELE|nr:hypothetical protein JZ751_017564 [Albula glossodonta]
MSLRPGPSKFPVYFCVDVPEMQKHGMLLYRKPKAAAVKGHGKLQPQTDSHGHMKNLLSEAHLLAICPQTCSPSLSLMNWAIRKAARTRKRSPMIPCGAEYPQPLSSPGQKNANMGQLQPYRADGVLLIVHQATGGFSTAPLRPTDRPSPSSVSLPHILSPPPSGSTPQPLCTAPYRTTRQGSPYPATMASTVSDADPRHRLDRHRPQRDDSQHRTQL